MPEDPPPPHPLKRLRLATLNDSSNNVWKRRRFFQPKKQSAIVNAEPENSELEVRRNAAVAVEVVTVSVVVTAAPDGVTVAGEKLQDVPDDKPEQANEIVE